MYCMLICNIIFKYHFLKFYHGKWQFMKWLVRYETLSKYRKGIPNINEIVQLVYRKLHVDIHFSFICCFSHYLMKSLLVTKPWYWLKFISLEPAYFFYTVALILFEFGNTNLYLQKACRTNATIEPNLSTPCDDKEKRIMFVANVNAYVRSVKMIFIMISVVMYSSWSDKAGRKRNFFLMSTMTGLLFESAFGCIYSYNWTASATYAALTSAVLQILFGNAFTIKAFGYMYLADVVDQTNGTMRFGILTAVKTLATLVAKSLSGYLLNTCGFYIYYAICMGISLLAVVFGYSFIEDISVPMEKKASFSSMFNIKSNLTESSKVVFGKGTMKQKITVVLLMGICCVLLFS